jgi:hypothetical protein
MHVIYLTNIYPRPYCKKMPSKNSDKNEITRTLPGCYVLHGYRDRLQVVRNRFCGIRIDSCTCPSKIKKSGSVLQKTLSCLSLVDTARLKDATNSHTLTDKKNLKNHLYPIKSSRARICKLFKEPKNRFPAWRNRCLCSSLDIYKYGLCLEV